MIGRRAVKAHIRDFKQAREAARRHALEVEVPRLGALALSEFPESPMHTLPHPVIVTLTSYPARFATLHLTLRSLLLQTVRPDAIALWLTREDRALVPEKVTELEALGLKIETCTELRSYKKIVPALKAWPEAVLIAADDDLYFPQDWLERLLAAYDGKSVQCHRAHRIRSTWSGRPRPYADWDRYLTAATSGSMIFPTSGGGATYSADLLHEDVTREDLFTELAPTTDDVWLYFMTRLAGRHASKLAGQFHLIEWPGSQETNLKGANLYGEGNDKALSAMTRYYGWPR
ncbi:MAG: glycosyltransferase family 2 protein [Pseudomonadota bacterium]